MSGTVAFLVNDDPHGPIGIRARSFAERLRPQFDIRSAHLTENRFQSGFNFLRFLYRTKPDLTYVFDMSATGVAAGFLHKSVTGTPVIIDTGDAISALSRSLGRGPVAHGLTVALEEASLRWCDHLVVRGSKHEELLETRGLQKATVVQDGVDTDQFQPTTGKDVRSSLGIDDQVVIGTLGSANWNENLKTCYGWELIEVVHSLRDRPVHGLMIGDGSGIPRMRAQVKEWGIEDRVHFLGYVPYGDLPSYINAMDIALSKQMNDVVGEVRTTGKLPLYMACGTYVLATEVGEAERVLPDSMLVPLNGVDDPSFTGRLEDRISTLLDCPGRLRKGVENRRRAKDLFDYEVLSARLGRLLRRFV
jgi:glycosyltransferase involved in cell wall biosynthesis